MIARTHPRLALATAFVLAGCTGSADAPSYTFGMMGATPEAAHTTGPVHAFHIPMRDGTRIALDLKAIIPRFLDFDPYTDLYFPGGIFHLAFGKNWSESVRSQDMNEKRMGPDGVTRGVRPVDDDPDGSSLLAAIKERAPLPGYYDGLVQVVYRDDQPDIWDGTFDDFGIHTQRDVVERTGLAIYTWGGWMDAGTAAGVLKRFRTWRTPSWPSSGPGAMAAAITQARTCRPRPPTDPNSETQSLETVRFFNWYLRGSDTGIPERLLLYYTMGEEVWKSTPTWPPVGSSPVRWYLAPAGSLGDDPPDADAAPTHTPSTTRLRPARPIGGTRSGVVET